MKTNSQTNLQSAITDIQNELATEKTARQEATDVIQNANELNIVLDLNNAVIAQITIAQNALQGLATLLDECDFNIPK